MVMREDGDGKMIMTKYVGNNFLGKKPLQVLSGIGCWCLGGLSILFRWSLVSWWHFGGVSIVS